MSSVNMESKDSKFTDLNVANTAIINNLSTKSATFQSSYSETNISKNFTSDTASIKIIKSDNIISKDCEFEKSNIKSLKSDQVNTLKLSSDNILSNEILSKNINSDSASIENLKCSNGILDILIAPKAEIKDAKISILDSDNIISHSANLIKLESNSSILNDVTITSLTSINNNLVELKSDKSTIKTLHVTESADIENLKIGNCVFDEFAASHAEISKIDVCQIKSVNLESDTSKIGIINSTGITAENLNVTNFELQAGKIDTLTTGILYSNKITAKNSSLENLETKNITTNLVSSSGNNNYIKFTPENTEIKGENSVSLSCEQETLVIDKNQNTILKGPLVFDNSNSFVTLITEKDAKESRIHTIPHVDKDSYFVLADKGESGQFLTCGESGNNWLSLPEPSIENKPSTLVVRNNDCSIESNSVKVQELYIGKTILTTLPSIGVDTLSRSKGLGTQVVNYNKELSTGSGEIDLGKFILPMDYGSGYSLSVSFTAMADMSIINDKGETSSDIYVSLRDEKGIDHFTIRNTIFNATDLLAQGSILFHGSVLSGFRWTAGKSFSVIVRMIPMTENPTTDILKSINVTWNLTSYYTNINTDLNNTILSSDILTTTGGIRNNVYTAKDEGIILIDASYSIIDCDASGPLSFILPPVGFNPGQNYKFLLSSPHSVTLHCFNLNDINDDLIVDKGKIGSSLKYNTQYSTLLVTNNGKNKWFVS